MGKRIFEIHPPGKSVTTIHADGMISGPVPETDLLIITAYNAAGKTIACICHGAQMLISAKVLPGRKASGYYSIKDDIENAGATYVDAPAVVDNNLVCCPHYDHMGKWLKEALDVYTKKRYG